MARRATKDTFAFEPAGPDIEVRRKVFAGQMIPDGYRLESESAAEDVGESAPTGYPHEYTTGQGGTAHDYSGLDRGEEGERGGRKLSNHTVAELRDLAAARGVDVPENAKKADLVEALGGDE